MRRCLLAAAAAAACLPAAPATAYTFVSPRAPRWEKPVVSYAVSGLPVGAVERGARAWNRLGLRVRLVRTTRTASADLRVSGRSGPCTGAVGVTNVGEVSFSDGRRRFTLLLGPFTIRMARACRATIPYIAAHEFGHALGLGHEARRCALMNPGGDDELRRSQCPRRSAAYWLANLLQPDDRAGVRSLYRRPLQPGLYDLLPPLP